jgi:hemerythrin
VLNDLTHYAENHFSREEKLLMEQKYPDINAQIEQHKLFLSKINEFKDNFDKGNNAVAVAMLPFLNNWFLNHIMKIDMKYKTAV